MHAAVGALSDRGAGDRRKCHFQYGTRRRGLQAVRCRRACRQLFLRGGDRAACNHLPAGYRRYRFADSRKDRRPTGVRSSQKVNRPRFYLIVFARRITILPMLEARL
jgi:hypothetical protein